MRIPRIGILDYRAGNVASVIKAFAAVGADATNAHTPQDLADADAIVVPGVGHFGATRVIDLDWRAAIARAVDARIPLLGICLGMQWLFDGSEEAPGVAGFGAFRGQCRRLSGDVKVPHVGWNTLENRDRTSVLLDGIDAEAAAYFTHTFAAPIVAHVTATTTHGETFASVIERDRVFGAQFHPEKSGATGLRLLANFVRVAQTAD